MTTRLGGCDPWLAIGLGICRLVAHGRDGKKVRREVHGGINLRLLKLFFGRSKVNCLHHVYVHGQSLVKVMGKRCRL